MNFWIYNLISRLFFKKVLPSLFCLKLFIVRFNIIFFFVRKFRLQKNFLLQNSWKKNLFIKQKLFQSEKNFISSSHLMKLFSLQSQEDILMISHRMINSEIYSHKISLPLPRQLNSSSYNSSVIRHHIRYIPQIKGLNLSLYPRINRIITLSLKELFQKQLKSLLN